MVRQPDRGIAERGMKFSVEFSAAARENLRGLRKRDQQTIADAIRGHLTYQPAGATRNRKLLEENPLAPWELRVGDFRVFYDVDEGAATVVIMAVGRKVHNGLFIGGEEVRL